MFTHSFPVPRNSVGVGTDTDTGVAVRGGTDVCVDAVVHGVAAAVVAVVAAVAAVAAASAAAVVVVVIGDLDS